MFTPQRAFLVLTALVAGLAATQASAQSCCSCAYAYTCAPPSPPQIQVWGLSPSYGVIQGPVYTGPGYYTAPIYQGEVSTADYPYSGSSDFFDPGPNVDPFRNNLYHPYWPMLPGLSLRRSHLHESGAFYHGGVGAHLMVSSTAGHAPRTHKGAHEGAER